MTTAITQPIILFAFDRPSYLRRVLDSLKAQRGVTLDPADIWLLQDGAVSGLTGVRYAEDADIAASIAAFRAVFPRGQVVASDSNLGIARNIRRGEALAFDRLGAETAYFFEDDLELGPWYLAALDRMREQVEAHPSIGYFACYGDHYAPVPGPVARWRPLDHHWGFGLRAAAWRRIRDWLAPYDEMLGRSDYAHRSHRQVFDWIATLPVATDKSSQDAVKTIACADLGIARVMTDLGFGRYIGETGASFTPARYRELGFDRMLAFNRADFTIADLTADRLARILEGQQHKAREFRRVEFDAFLARYGARNFNPDRLVTREDVDLLYQSIMDRLPEGEHIYGEVVGQRGFRSLRATMMNGNEYRGRNTGREG